MILDKESEYLITEESLEELKAESLEMDNNIEGVEGGVDEEENESSEEFEHYRFVVDKGQSLLRIDKFITSKLENTSRHRVQLSLSAEQVRVNDKIVKANYKVKPNDVITIVLPYQRRGIEVRPEKIDLNNSYLNDDVNLP